MLNNVTPDSRCSLSNQARRCLLRGYSMYVYAQKYCYQLHVAKCLMFCKLFKVKIVAASQITDLDGILGGNPSL